MSEPLLEVRDLHKSFELEGQKIEVLRGIHLTLNDGDRVAVIGSSGAGKSTLLHLLGALDVPTSGSLKFKGRELSSLKPSELARFRSQSIGFMFQFHHLLPEFSALENVMMPALIARRSKADARKEALQWIEEVGLSHRMNHRPGELSGGEQQRIALARALMGKPDLLLADEPTGNLDSKTGEEIHQLFETLYERMGTALLVVTHNASLAARMPRCVTMRDGLLYEDEAR